MSESAGPESLSIIRSLQDLFSRHGAHCYTGPREEPVSVLDHALQCAGLAERAGANSALITAALLHDVGHFIAQPGNDDETGDDRHEQTGAHWLSRWFGPSVTEPVRLHVDAKRYLCAVKPAYFESLSAASVHSLDLQGGWFNADEAKRFIDMPYARDAVRLRVWDDLAKVPAADTAPLDRYLLMVSALFDRDTGRFLG